MGNVILLLSENVWYFLLVSGVVTLFVSVVRVVDLQKGKFEPRERIGWKAFYLGCLLLILGIVAYFFRERLGIYPSVEGRWVYEVHTSDGTFSHKGDCVIKQAGSELQISGVRRYTCVDDGTSCRVVDVNAAWSSTWAQITSDDRVRFEYEINLDEHIKGFCRLSMPDGSNDELSGSYYLLPPLPAKTPNALSGLIVFRRMPPGVKTAPKPTEADLSKPLKTRGP